MGGIVANAKAASVVLVDGKSGATALAELLREQKDERGRRVLPDKAVRVATVGEVQTAESAFLNEVSERRIRHMSQRKLDESARTSVRRNIGKNGAFGFGDGEKGSSAPIESASFALHGARTSKRNPRRRQEVRA